MEDTPLAVLSHWIGGRQHNAGHIAPLLVPLPPAALALLPELPAQFPLEVSIPDHPLDGQKIPGDWRAK